MATIITSECINCGACEPECPNTAIYAGGVLWELGGESHEPLSQDIYYIVPSKCTECVGFHDHEACAAVCPVDCCIPDPNNPETEEVLLARARQLHPDENIPDDAPSRFRTGSAATGAAPAAPAAEAAAAAASGDGAAPAAATPAPKAAPAPAAPAAAKPAATPAPSPAPAPSVSDEFDPATWEVPIVCKDCNERYTIPYRYFQAGVVFYCPSCSGSFVPKSTMCRTVQEKFESFYARRLEERKAYERRRAREQARFESRQEAEMKAFRAELEEMAEQLKPAGKLVRPKGLASMFT